MAKANGAQGYYFNLEARLFEQGWPGRQVATFIALLKLACESNNGIGIYRYTLMEIAETIGKSDFNERIPREKVVATVLRELEERGSIKMFDGRYIFILDFWSYKHSGGNENHRKGAARSLCGLPPELVSAFRSHYGNGIQDGMADGIKDGMADGIPDGIGDGIGYGIGNGIGDGMADYPNTNANPSLVDLRKSTTAGPAAQAGLKSGKQSAKTSARPKPEPNPPPPDDCIKLAHMICGRLDQARADGLTVLNPRTEATLARFIERSGFPPRLLAEAWSWGWEDPYWRSQMLNMASWETKNRWAQLVNQYQISLGKGGDKSAQASQTPKTRDELDVERRLLREQEEAAKSPEQRAEEQRKLNELLGKGAKA